jgi:hypothetical protein
LEILREKDEGTPNFLMDSILPVKSSSLLLYFIIYLLYDKPKNRRTKGFPAENRKDYR